MTVSALRRIATPKKTIAGAAVALAAAGMALSSVPAHAAAPAAAPAVVAPAAAGSPKEIAKKMIPDQAQYAAFSKIVSHESGWNPSASNSSSGAYGLVQALPGSKMASAGSDWKTNPATQIKWGLDYMNDRYGSPVEAWNFWQANGWY
ncbi:transglycosylase SLT domain-containing protein [Streptomyces sp. LHD-70]|uniref:aggregation-promoting factor C-terminal-like domain-containing protein n=1 Tax=Streptomyces sp. LHD-70 TaxID=3072140 RepID=UPI00280C5AC6|nr:transglycosylase SLT domain-containing protein [Streptomyces sp. LHD-70]MDQ8701275.1 transglycosylase SLT domain-containing protein [Streptomyces sp. LHD-70]